MPERQELEALRALSQAVQSGDPRAELEALRSLSAMKQQTDGRTSEPGPTVTGIINRGGSFAGGALEPPVQKKPPSLEGRVSMGTRANSRFLADVLNTPHAIGELMSTGAAGLQAGVGSLFGRKDIGQLITGRPQTFGERFATAKKEQEQSFPASLFLKFPKVTPEGVGAFGQTVSELPSIMFGSPTLKGTFQKNLEEQQRFAEDHPIQTAIGDIGGDTAALLAARPFTRRLFSGARAAPIAERAAEDIIDSAANRITKVTGFAKKLGSQAGEAGFEGALLAAVGDGDPIATAGYSAGTQLGGALALKSATAFARYPWKTLGGIALAHWALRAVGPGNQGSLEDVRDESIRTMVTAFGLGAIGAMAGAGRLSPGTTAARESFIDALDTIRRAPVVSIIKQLNEAEQNGDNRLDRIIGKLIEEPDFFGREARMRIERAANSGKSDALTKEVKSLMRSERFRRKFDDL